MRRNPKIFLICVMTFNLVLFLGYTFRNVKSGQLLVHQPAKIQSLRKSSIRELKIDSLNKTNFVKHLPKEEGFSKSNSTQELKVIYSKLKWRDFKLISYYKSISSHPFMSHIYKMYFLLFGTHTKIKME